MRRLRDNLTYANVTASLALFLALGGVAYATNALPVGSVGTKQLKKGAVTGPKVRKGSLLASDFKPGQIPPGAEGPPGPKGEPGAAGATSAVTRYGPDVDLPASSGSFSYAACRPGEALTGGGYDFAGSGSGRPIGTSYYVTLDRPNVEEEFMGTPSYPAPSDGSPATGWAVGMENDTGSEFSFRAYAICASP